MPGEQLLPNSFYSCHFALFISLYKKHWPRKPNIKWSCPERRLPLKVHLEDPCGVARWVEGEIWEGNRNGVECGCENPGLVVP